MAVYRLGDKTPNIHPSAYIAETAAVVVIDEADRELASAVEDAGMRPIVMPTIMKQPGVAAALAQACHDAATGV